MKNTKSEEAVFKLFSNGICTARDEWVYDISKSNLERKIQFFSDIYNSSIENEIMNETIKWSRDMRKKYNVHKIASFNRDYISKSLYRPFTIKYYYGEMLFSDVLTKNHYDMHGAHLDNLNKVICFSGLASNNKFYCLSANSIVDIHFTGDTKCIPLYVYDSEGKKRNSNITQWGLEKFKKHYNDNSIDAEDIFYYTYAILHDPKYREKYAIDLKRHFPRLPFKEDFSKWVEWGKQLMDLHIDFESAKPYSLDKKENNFRGIIQNRSSNHM